MKRKTKNIIIITMIVLLGIANYFTISYASKSISSQSNDVQSQGEFGGMTPPDMNNSDSSNKNKTSETASDSTNKDKTSETVSDSTNKDKTSETASDNTDSSATELKGGRPGGFGNSNSRGPRPNDSSNSESSDSSNPPAKPDDSSDSNSESNTPPDMPDTSEGTQSNDSGRNFKNFSKGNNDIGKLKNSSKNLDIFYYVLFGTESLLISVLVMYLIMSSFNKKSFKETFMIKDKIVIFVLASIILTGGITFGDSYLAQNAFINSNEVVSSSKSSEASGAKTVNGTSETLTDTYDSSKNDESAILVQNGGSATIKGAKINKSGDSSNTENSEFYGVNSGILVQKNSKAKISKATIKTDAKGSNAVFATGEGAEIEISDSTITTTGSSSARGLDATYGGTIKADNVTIKTDGGSCATLATDRGEGTVTVSNSDLETNGAGSPLIYSTGNISIDNTKGISNGSQMVVIEGKNSATVTNSTLSASGKGNRGDVDNAGVMIYQSMSGDASSGTGNFTAKNSTLKIDSSSDYYKSAPMFFITNTSAVINLENTKLEYGSNVLISIKGTSEWGNSGSNGGDLEFNAVNQELEGNIEIDNISTMKLNLTKSNYRGTINGDNSAKEVSLKIDKDSKITLTGDSYVTSLEDADGSYSNIDFNGYKLYVNGKAIN